MNTFAAKTKFIKNSCLIIMDLFIISIVRIIIAAFIFLNKWKKKFSSPLTIITLMPVFTALKIDYVTRFTFINQLNAFAHTLGIIISTIRTKSCDTNLTDNLSLLLSLLSLTIQFLTILLSVCLNRNKHKCRSYVYMQIQQAR